MNQETPLCQRFVPLEEKVDQALRSIHQENSCRDRIVLNQPFFISHTTVIYTCYERLRHSPMFTRMAAGAV